MNSGWARWPCCLSKCPLKHDFLDIYLTAFSESVISQIQKLWEWSFVSKCSKFELDFKNALKNSKKPFCFWDIWIWIGIVKLSLLRTRYFLSAGNLLTGSPKIFHVNKRECWACWPCCLPKGLLKQDFLDTYLTGLWESVISEIQKLFESFFFFKYSKFNLDLKNAAKSWQKLFCFSDNCIWIGIVKMSLFRTGYFSSVANVLTRYPQIWYVNKGDFFEKNFLASDQWVWYSCYDIAVACLGTSTILLVEASSETWLFRDLSDSDFEVCNFQNTKSMRVIFRFKMSKT